MNIALTGIPLGLFVLFSFTVASFSLVAGLLLGLLGAVLVSMFFISLALSIVFPAVFFTTMTACFLFLWTMGGYHLLKWLNGTSDGDGNESKPLLSSGSIGDSLNSPTGGRLTGFMDSARAEMDKDDTTDLSNGNTEKKPPPAEKGPKDQSTQPVKPVMKQKPNVASAAVPIETLNPPKVAKLQTISNAPKTATNTAAVAKGGVAGVTGLG